MHALPWQSYDSCDHDRSASTWYTALRTGACWDRLRRRKPSSSCSSVTPSPPAVSDGRCDSDICTCASPHPLASTPAGVRGECINLQLGTFNAMPQMSWNCPARSCQA